MRVSPRAVPPGTVLARVVVLAAGFGLPTGLAVPPARAQAWVPPAGTGTVTIAFQAIDNTGHVNTGGVTIPEGKSRNASVYVEVDYAITDRLSISAGVPVVFAKYFGPPSPFFPPLQPVDSCYCWQAGLQDVGFTVRANVLDGRIAVTPSIAVGVPSHDYAYVGEAVVGRHLNEVRLAVDAGARLDPISPRLFVQGRYAYAFVEDVLDVSTDRSNIVAEVSVQVMRRLSVEGVVSRQITHGGLRAGTAPPPPGGIPWGDITTPELFREHDRLMRDNYWHVGGGVTWSLSWANVFASYVAFTGGTDTHAGRALTVGLGIPFGR